MTVKTSSQMPIVNLNGSDPDVLVDAALKTAQALRKALDAMSQSAPHGRDYQTSAGAYTIARREFEERIAEVREIADFYEDMADNIQDQVIDRKRSRALFASPDPLRDEVIRLAHENPELRAELLPLLKTADTSMEEINDRIKAMIQMIGGTPDAAKAWDPDTIAKYLRENRDDEAAEVVLSRKPKPDTRKKLPVKPPKGVRGAEMVLEQAQALFNGEGDLLTAKSYANDAAKRYHHSKSPRDERVALATFYRALAKAMKKSGAGRDAAPFAKSLVSMAESLESLTQHWDELGSRDR